MEKTQEIKKILSDAEDYGLLIINDDKLGTVANDISGKIAKLFTPPTDEGLREKIAIEIIWQRFGRGWFKGREQCRKWADYNDAWGFYLKDADSILAILADFKQVEKDQVQLSDTDETIIEKTGLDPYVVRDMIKAGWRKIR